MSRNSRCQRRLKRQMSQTVEIGVVVVVAIAIAVAVERAIRFWCRRLEDDLYRVDAASMALRRHADLLDKVLARTAVPASVSEALISASLLIGSKEAAHWMVKWLGGGVPTSELEDDPLLAADLILLEKTDRDGF